VAGDALEAGISHNAEGEAGVSEVVDASGDEAAVVSRLSPRLGFASRIKGRSSARTRLAAFIGVALAAGLVGAAVVIPLAASPQSPSATTTAPIVAKATGGNPSISVPDPSGSVASWPAATPDSNSTPESSTSTMPGNGPIVVGSTPPDSGGDWYTKLKISYTEAIRGGNSARITVSGIGAGQCLGEYTYARPYASLTGGSVDALGPDGADPWNGGFDTAETYVGTIDVKLTCYSSGWKRGYAHTFHQPVQVLPAEPWAISSSMDGYIGEGLQFAYEVEDPNFNSPWGWRDGSCVLTVNIPGGAPIVDSGLYWHQGMKFNKAIAAIPADASPGLVHWSMKCTDGGPGWPAELTTTASASGSYDLEPRGAPPTSTDPTQTPGPTPTTDPTQTPGPTPTTDPTQTPGPTPTTDPTPTVTPIPNPTQTPAA
jgi:hypothetical protein